MNLNVKDLWAGGLVVLVAVAGLWINGGLFGLGWEQHALGTARRMGPGYMPMLTFWLLLGLGAVVLGLALVNGPDPLGRWSRLDLRACLASVLVGLVTWQLMERLGWTRDYVQLGIASLLAMLVISVSPGWRAIGMVHAGMAVFGLTLEPLGLMLAIALTVGVSALGDPEHRPLGVLGTALFLCALCWLVFIRYLDIRVPVWPTVI